MPDKSLGDLELVFQRKKFIGAGGMGFALHL